MSATQKFFRFVFGSAGDRAAIPDPTAGDGSVSYQNGYGVDYERATGDPLKKNIERTKLNQALYDLSLGLRQYQLHGFPEYVTAAENGGAAVAYDKNAYVLWTDGNVYMSLVAANTSDPSDLTKWQAIGSRVGEIVDTTGNVAPAGAVKANGALLSRAAYPALWAFALASGNLAVSDGAWLKGQYSPGDGATTFRIPDYRGHHRRGWDDAAGVDAGRVLGSVQADQNAAHTHGVTDTGHTHGLGDPGHQHTIYSGAGVGGNAPIMDADGNPQQTPQATSVSGTGQWVGAAATGVTVQSQGGTEVRVKNIANLVCIRYL